MTIKDYFYEKIEKEPKKGDKVTSPDGQHTYLIVQDLVDNTFALLNLQTNVYISSKYNNAKELVDYYNCKLVKSNSKYQLHSRLVDIEHLTFKYDGDLMRLCQIDSGVYKLLSLIEGDCLNRWNDETTNNTKVDYSTLKRLFGKNFLEEEIKDIEVINKKLKFTF